MSPSVAFEHEFIQQGYQAIAGVDEAGRGCWAGPVVAAAVVLDPAIRLQPERWAQVNDSKTLTARQRSALFAQITSQAAGWGIGIVPAHIIDSHGILPATRLAMEIALLRLPQPPEALLLDAVQLHGWRCPQLSLIKGDARSLSIAAASIIAKVTRDQLMEQLHSAFPAYRFGVHKGYGTADHVAALHRFGPTTHHRRTFRPISHFIETGEWPADPRISDHHRMRSADRQ